MTAPEPGRPERIGVKRLVETLGDWRRGSEATLPEQLAAAIEQAVEEGWLVGGARLPAERSMAVALGVSRSTVTTSLGILKDRGRLQARHGSGTVISRPASGSELPIDLSEIGDGGRQALPNLDLESLLESATTGFNAEHDSHGLPLLRSTIAEVFTEQGLASHADQILVTNGAQHAIALCLAVLAQPGDRVLIETPSYPGVLQLLAARGLEPVSVPRSVGPVDVDHLEAILSTTDCRLAYLQTLVHNPTGATSDSASLDALAAVLDRFDVTLIEDLVLADLRFDGGGVQSVAARREGPTVAVGSVSKLGWGGLRIGWLRASPDLVQAMSRLRRVGDLGSSVPAQVISVAVLDDRAGLFGARRATLEARAAVLDRALVGLDGWTWTAPQGGFSIWVELAEPLADELVAAARERGVLVAAGHDSVLDPGLGSRHLRLCFDRPEPQLELGARRLCEAWKALSPPRA